MKTLKRLSLPAVLTIATLWSGASVAAGSIPSCYDSKLPAPVKPGATELFVVVDQTTLLDDQLKQAVANQVRPFLAPGNGFSVLVFSAFTQGKYTQLMASGQLDYPLDVKLRNDVSKPVLSKFDKCIANQVSLASQVVGGALRGAFDGASGEIAKSDVLASLRDISATVRQSRATEKVVLIVSDMLENSSVSSFYVSQAVRKIDPAHELKLVQSNQMAGDFGGARLYVLGAGLLNIDDKKNKAQYRDPKTMSALASFWKSYFDQSKAQLIEFGQPALLNQIK